MKSLFRVLFCAAVSAVLCVSVFSSCNKEEELGLFLEMPGHIVSEFNQTLVIPFVSRNIASITVSSIPEGWTVENLDMVARTVTIKAPSAFATADNKIEENGLLTLRGFTPAGTATTSTAYLSLLNKHIDLSDKYSNSYVISEKNTRYTIDLTHKGESSEKIAPFGAYILWQTSEELLNYSSYDAATGKFTFFVAGEDIKDDNGKVIDNRIPDGNALIIAYNEDGATLWSWHVWVTSSDVESSAITTSAGVFMDRNLGAYRNSNGSTAADDIYGSYGLYYQWGRKDPFVRPIDYRFTGDHDQVLYSDVDTDMKILYANKESDESVGTLEYAMQNPLSYVLGSADNAYDWLYSSHDDNLWSANSKSVNDPCPRGWRVPAANAFEVFDIDEAEDLDALANVRNMYGWHLVDKNTGVKMFMPGAGRRSFETGVLVNVNNYGYENVPAPWTGYYWTAGVSEGGKARSMSFDLNTTRAVNNRYSANTPMYRANGMQIRCVRE